MSGPFSPLRVIINPPGVQSALPGQTLEFYVVVMNQGDRNAVIDVFLDESFQMLTQLAAAPYERVALAPQQSIEVSFQIPIPADTFPGTYDYILTIDAPQDYPADTPIQYLQQVKVLLAEHPIVSEHDPTFALQPSSNPGQPLPFQVGYPLQVAIEVNNRSQRVDSFRLSCPDIEADWHTIRYPALGVENSGLVAGGNRLELNPGKVGQIWLDLHPPASALAGNYAFTLRLHSENSPDLVMLDLVYLQVPPVYNLGLKLNAILGRVRHKPGRYQIEIANFGNTIRQLAVSARTQGEEELCIYRLDPDRVKLLPAKQAIVDLSVRPQYKHRQPLVGMGQTIDFQVEVTDLEGLAIADGLLSQTLVWQARPWWQVWLLILFILAILGSLGLMAWLWLYPHPVKIENFAPESRKTIEGDRVRLNWRVDNLPANTSFQLITKGTIPNQRDLKIADLIGTGEDPDRPCQQQQRTLSCQNFETEVTEAGKYTFELKAVDRDNRPIASQTTEEVEVVAKPEPEIQDLKTNKTTYNRGEPIKLDLPIKYIEKLGAVRIAAKTEDGKILADRRVAVAELKQKCKTDAQTMLCTGLDLDLKQSGKYQLEVSAVSTSKKAPAPTPKLVKIEILRKQLKIVSFSLDGSDEESRILTEGQNVTLSWQVEGEDDLQLEIQPFGTVPKSGQKQFQVTTAIPAQISLIATDKDGQKVTKGFSIKVQAATAPTETPTISPAPTPADREIPGSKPSPKPSGDLSI